MKEKILLVLISNLISVSVSGINQIKNSNPISNGMGNTWVSLQEGKYTIGNQAIYAENEKININAAYQNNFLLKELSTGQFSFVVPTAYIHVGGYLSYFGFSLYNEIMAGVHFSHQFSKKISLGIEIDYLSIHANKGEKRPFAIIPQLGIVSNPYKNLYIGFHAYNFSFSKLLHTDRKILVPPSFTIGISNVFGKNFLLTTQLQKTIHHSFSGGFGIQYTLFNMFSFRIGFSAVPIINTFGIGMNFSSFSFDMAIQYHWNLGIVPSAGIRYNFNFPKK